MLRRRQVLAASILAASAAPAAAAAMAEATLSAEPPSGSAGGQVWRSPPNCYFAYPQSNGFLPGSLSPVIARRAGQSVAFCEWDFRTGALRELVRTAVENMYWDIAEATGELFFVDGRTRIVSVPARDGKTAHPTATIHRDEGERMEDLLSVRRDGSAVLCGLERVASDTGAVQSARVLELDIASRAVQPVCDMPFDADHPQYCPHDETWIGFAHEGDISRSLDRVWGLQRGAAAARPAPLWNEQAPGSGVLFAGHERWMFHRTGALVVAYPGSPGRPRGLYSVDAPSRRARLVSASDYDWHCNISRSGAWAVVDTMTLGAGLREPDGRVISDVVLVDMTTGQRRWLARSHAGAHHPWHPHPHFTPDERFVIYNDFQADGAGRASRTVVQEILPNP